MTDAPARRHTRGYMLRHLCEFVDLRLPAPERRRLRAAQPEAFALAGRVPFDEQVPLRHGNAVMREMTAPLAPRAAYELAFGVGQHVGAVALDTFLRLITRFVRPAVFGHKLGDLFRHDHDFGRIDVDLSQVDRRRMVIKLLDVEGYLHAAAMVSGWVSSPLRGMGCRNLRFVDTLNPPPTPQDRPEYHLQISWDLAYAPERPPAPRCTCPIAFSLFATSGPPHPPWSPRCSGAATRCTLPPRPRRPGGCCASMRRSRSRCWRCRCRASTCAPSPRGFASRACPS